MANPRQRSKARSSRSSKPSLNSKRRMHQKLRRAPPLLGPAAEILSSKWDKTKTVFQNYAALGLLPSIPVAPRSSLGDGNGRRGQKADLPFLPPHMRSTALSSVDEEVAPKIGYGRIIRDEKGNVIDIIIDGDDDEDNVVEEEQDEEGDVVIEKVEGKTDVIRSLEALSALSAPVHRHTSSSEKAWLTQLVLKYNDDVERMSRDRKLNVWQKTPGDLRKMIRKAGGAEKLKSQ